MATIVVTGAVGGAGSWVVDHLADRGHHVIGLDLEGDQAALSNAKAAAYLDWAPAHTWREAETEDVPGPSFLD